MRPRRPEVVGKAGYSVLEMLVVLAIMALGAAIVMPRGATALDRMMTHVVFFEFQRDVADLRREAYRREQPVTVAASPDGATVEMPALRMRPAWSYRLDQPLRISAGGACPDARVTVLRDSTIVMHLVTDDRACHFTRLD